jgi:predicted DNA-binding protein (MmcQ/YjbR family)
MNADSIREYCLSLSQATEKLQWEDNLCFKVNGKIFAMLGLDSVPQRLCFKCDPETFAELCERDGIHPAPYVGRYKWVMLDRLDALGGGELQELIRVSYETVSAKGLRGAKSKSKKPGQSRSKGKAKH